MNGFSSDLSSSVHYESHEPRGRVGKANLRNRNVHPVLHRCWRILRVHERASIRPEAKIPGRYLIKKPGVPRRRLLCAADTRNQPVRTRTVVEQQLTR